MLHVVLRTGGCLSGLILLLWANSLFAAEASSGRAEEIARWLPAAPAAPCRPISERAAWAKLASLPAFWSVLTNAQKLAQEPMPKLPDELYLDFSRTGNRDRCQKVLGARDGRVTTFALAECLENKGRYLQPLGEALTAICQERTWVLPAHDRSLDNFQGRSRDMDLRATLVAWDLASVDYILGDKLPAAQREMLRANVRNRVLLPFREMIEGKRKEIYWMRATHNWNAVCLAGIAGAALALEGDRQERAFYVAAAEQHIQYFLSGFTTDGYCSEGMGYWNYGFGRFIMLSETLRQATGGHLDLMATPNALAPALFSTRSEVVNGLYPTIADCHPGSGPDPQLVRYIAERLGLSRPTAPSADFKRPSGSVAPTVLFAFLQEPLPKIETSALPPDSPLRTWFNLGGVLICRAGSNSTAFAAVLKGGHNAEHHNHNDVGSFSVVSGNSMLVCDPGGEVYTARTFSSRRYDSKVLNSFGHAVPVVAGKLQETGSNARAVVLRSDFSDTEDVLALDLRSAYRVPELKKLERTFTFQRTSPGLSVRDEVAFSSAKPFEVALVTWGNWKKVSERELRLRDKERGVRVLIDSGGLPLTFTSEKLDEDVPTRTKPTRIGIGLKAPVTSAVLTITIAPDTR